VCAASAAPHEKRPEREKASQRKDSIQLIWHNLTANSYRSSKYLTGNG
jgi:hypothetical protein